MSRWCASRDADSVPGWNCWHTTNFLIRAEVRRAVLAAMNAHSASVADLARLNFLLGDLYADAVRTAQRRARLQCELVGCHGQTLYHQGDAKPYLGRRIACTWQTGEAAIIAAKIGVPVVSDFRPADMAAGGKGAPSRAVSRLCSLPPSPLRAHRAEPWWHRQPDGDSAARVARTGRSPSIPGRATW